jgi:hypothetical protein
MDEQLLGLIKQKIKEGKTKEEIKLLFLSQGWLEEEIDKSFLIFSEELAALPGVISLFKETWLIYRKKIVTILGISFIPLTVSLILYFVLYFLSEGRLFAVNVSESFNFSLFFNLTISIFSAVIATIFQTWSYLALIYAIKDDQEVIGVKQSYVLSWNNIFSYWWIAFLMGTIAVCGVFLFAIPAIIFSIWFLFAPIILVTENIRGMSALLKSKQYVKGNLMSLAWRFFAIFFILSLFFIPVFLVMKLDNITLRIEDIFMYQGNFFSVASTIFSFAVFPFVIIYYFLIYNYLKKAKGNFVFIPNPKEKKMFIFIGILGIILPISLIVFSLFFIKQAFLNWDRIADERRSSDINLISMAMNIYYEENRRYPEITVTNGRINLPNIGQYLQAVPSDPGIGKIKGCNDVSGLPYLGVDNTIDRSKYCIFTCLNDGSFLAASQKGTTTLNRVPIGLNCWGEEETNEILSWKTYINDEYGFRMNYPENFFFDEPKIATTDCDYLNLSANQCPYIPVAGFNIEKEEDLEKAMVSGLIKIEKVRINETDYCLQQSIEGAAGSNYANYYYVTQKNDKCFVLNLIVKSINCGVFGSSEDENYKKCENENNIERQKLFNKIISTFKFSD